MKVWVCKFMAVRLIWYLKFVQSFESETAEAEKMEFKIVRF